MSRVSRQRQAIADNIGSAHVSNPPPRHKRRKKTRGGPTDRQVLGNAKANLTRAATRPVGDPGPTLREQRANRT